MKDNHSWLVALRERLVALFPGLGKALLVAVAFLLGLFVALLDPHAVATFCGSSWSDPLDLNPEWPPVQFSPSSP